MNTVISFLLAVIFLLSAGPALADAEAEITAALDYFDQIWNEGDLDSIRGYYHPEFVLVTEKGSIPLGQRIDDLEEIARAGEDRGVLSHSQTRIRALGDDHAVAYGQRKLLFKDGSAFEFWFSTVYVKTPFGWKAILTHN